MNPLGFMFVAIGVFAISGAVGDWDWFMNHRKSRLFVRLFSRLGARCFYILLGTGLMIFGFALALGMVDDGR